MPTLPIRLAPALVLLLSACATMSVQDAEKNLSIHIGERKLDDDWAGADEQPTAGVELDWRVPDAPIGYEVALFVSGGDEEGGTADEGGPLEGAVSISAANADLSVGVRKTFDQFGTRARTYVGAGFAFTRSELEAEFEKEPTGESETDTSLGVYAHVGVCWSVLTSSIVGLDYRLLAATDVELLDAVDSADSALFSVFLGFTF